MYVLMKVLMSAIIIGVVTEISRRFPTYGGIIAALPLVSLISFIWLYVQGEHNQSLSRFALGVLFGFPATAVLLFIVYISLRNSVSLIIAIAFGVGGWFVFLLLQESLLKVFKISLFN